MGGNSYTVSTENKIWYWVVPLDLNKIKKNKAKLSRTEDVTFY